MGVTSAINRQTGQFVANVRSPGLNSRDWIINPDLTAVVDVPEKYWRIDGDRIVEMDAREREVIDARELTAAKAKLTESMTRTDIALLALINEMRQRSGLPVLSIPEFIDGAVE
jgi:hypothetical protein